MDRHGIFLTSTGYRTFVRVGGRLYSRRFPPNATITEMHDWRAAIRTQKRLEAIAPHGVIARRGTFADDVTTYLETVARMPTYNERKAHMTLWMQEFGSRSRDSLTAPEIRAVLERWRATKSESTCNKRRTALMHFYSVMNGKSGRNPARDVPKYTEPEPEPRGYPHAIIKAILAQMQPSKSRARLKVIAWTGLSPASLERVTADDVSGDRLFRRRRRKGRGTSGKSIPLLPAAVSAFDELRKVRGFGAFDHRALNRVWLRAVAAFIAKIRKKTPAFTLPRFTVKDLRHSFGTRAYEVTGDLRIVGELLDHSTLDLTKRYTLKAVDARLETALSAVARSLGQRKVTGRVTTKPSRRRKSR